MPQDFFHHGALVNHGDDTHGVLAPGADTDTGAAPASGRQGARRRGEPQHLLREDAGEGVTRGA